MKYTPWGKRERPDWSNQNNTMPFDLEHVLVVPEKSRWHKDREKTGAEFVKFLKSNSLEFNEKTIQDFIRSWFITKRSSRRIKPENMSRKLSYLLEFFSNFREFQLTQTGLKRIKFVIHRWERAILEIDPDRKLQTKYLPLEKLKTLCLSLWKLDPTKRSQVHNKCAATVLLGCWLSGARQVDMLRLYWEDLRLKKNPAGVFLIAKIRHSKGNAGKRPEQLTFLKLEDPKVNFLRSLKKWWKYTGKPRRGKIFVNPLSKELLKGPAITRSYRNMARHLGWPESDWPRAHTGRKSLVLLLLKLGIDPVSLRIYLRWGPNSVMNSYYQSVGLETTEYGTSFKFGEILNSGKIFKMEQDL